MKPPSLPLPYPSSRAGDFDQNGFAYVPVECEPPTPFSVSLFLIAVEPYLPHPQTKAIDLAETVDHGSEIELFEIVGHLGSYISSSF